MGTGPSSDGALFAAEGILVFDYRFQDPSLPSGLWFCDGAETVHAIEINAVCLASGAAWDDLSKCLDFFKPYPYIVVVSPDRARREEIAHELRLRVRDTVFYVAADQAFRGCATVAELKDRYGQKALDQILLDAVELPAYGLLDLSDVTAPDAADIPVVRSGIPVLDRKIGGFALGELSVWTGRRGEGKSTLLSELLLEAVDQDRRVCAYSGELPAWKFKYWALLQAAGPARVVERLDKRTGKMLAAVPAPIQELIDEWWRRRFFLYDIGNSSTHDADNILRIFNYAHNCFGCEVFLVDNIMTARFSAGREKDYYRAQSNFVADLASFARRSKAHVHLVAHPRKTDGKHLGSDDVGGIGDITNLADNVFSLERNIRKGAKGEEAPIAPVTELAVLKNRMWGETTAKGVAIKLEFETRSKRFYREGDGPGRRYGWDMMDQTRLRELEEPDPDVPF